MKKIVYLVFILGLVACINSAPETGVTPEIRPSSPSSIPIPNAPLINPTAIKPSPSTEPIIAIPDVPSTINLPPLEPINIKNISRLKQLFEFNEGKKITDIVFSKKGKILAIASRNQRLNLWDLETGKLIYSLKHKNRISGIDISPDGKIVASILDGHEILLWDVATGNLLNTLKDENIDNLYKVTFHPSGTTLVSLESGGKIHFWNLRNGKLSSTSSISALDFVYLREGQAIATIYVFFNIYSGNPPSSWFDSSQKKPTGVANVIANNPRSDDIVTGNDNGELVFWDVNFGGNSYSVARIFTEHKEKITSVNFDPMGVLLATGSSDKTVRVWTKQQLLLTLEGHQAELTRVAFSWDNFLLVSGDEDGIVRLWGIAKP